MRRIVLNILVILSLAITPATVFSGLAAAACPAPSDAKTQVLHGVNEAGTGCSEAGVTNIFVVAVKILSIIAGAAGVLMVIVAGFKYITSNGDSGKVSSAKTTLIYALIGLAIAGLAQVLAHFAIGEAVKSTALLSIPLGIS